MGPGFQTGLQLSPVPHRSIFPGSRLALTVPGRYSCDGIQLYRVLCPTNDTLSLIFHVMQDHPTGENPRHNAKPYDGPRCALTPSVRLESACDPATLQPVSQKRLCKGSLKPASAHPSAQYFRRGPKPSKIHAVIVAPRTRASESASKSSKSISPSLVGVTRRAGRTPAESERQPLPLGRRPAVIPRRQPHWPNGDATACS